MVKSCAVKKKCRLLTCILENQHSKSAIILARKQSTAENRSGMVKDESIEVLHDNVVDEIGGGGEAASKEAAEEGGEENRVEKARKVDQRDSAPTSTSSRRRRRGKKSLLPQIITTSNLPQDSSEEKLGDHEEREAKNNSSMKILRPEEAMKNEDKSIQLEIHVKPLIVLDVNGILCHRIRDCDIPPLLLSELIQKNFEDEISRTNLEEGEDEKGKDRNNDENKKTIDDGTKLPKAFGDKVKKKQAKKDKMKQFCRSLYRSPTIGHVGGTPIIARTDLKDLLVFLDQHFTLAIFILHVELVS